MSMQMKWSNYGCVRDMLMFEIQFNWVRYKFWNLLKINSWIYYCVSRCQQDSGMIKCPHPNHINTCCIYTSAYWFQLHIWDLEIQIYFNKITNNSIFSNYRWIVSHADGDSFPECIRSAVVLVGLLYTDQSYHSSG